MHTHCHTICCLKLDGPKYQLRVITCISAGTSSGYILEMWATAVYNSQDISRAWIFVSKAKHQWFDHILTFLMLNLFPAFIVHAACWFVLASALQSPPPLDFRAYGIKKCGGHWEFSKHKVRLWCDLIHMFTPEQRLHWETAITLQHFLLREIRWSALVCIDAISHRFDMKGITPNNLGEEAYNHGILLKCVDEGIQIGTDCCVLLPPSSIARW